MPKFRTRSVAGRRIKGSANNGDIIPLIGLNQAFHGLQVGKSRDAGERNLDKY